MIPDRWYLDPVFLSQSFALPLHAPHHLPVAAAGLMEKEPAPLHWTWESFEVRQVRFRLNALFCLIYSLSSASICRVMYLPDGWATFTRR